MSGKKGSDNMKHKKKTIVFDFDGVIHKCYKDKKEVNNTYEPIVDINGSKITLIGFKEKKTRINSPSIALLFYVNLLDNFYLFFGLL